MNCFEWQNGSSDYLDGALLPLTKKEADAHLDRCRTCTERLKRYRQLTTFFSDQKRLPLPVSLRKTPLSPSLHPDIQALRRPLWTQLPWYLRTFVEGTGIVALILAGISAGPRIRALYEHNIERNFSEFTETPDRPVPGMPNVPLSRGNVLAEGTAGAGEEFSGSEAVSDSSEADDSAPATGALNPALVGKDEADDSDGGSGAGTGAPAVRVGRNEIWRFNLKTDSPHELRPRVVQLLTDLKVPPTTPGLGGIEAPGGIQFDLLLPQSLVAQLKQQIETLAPSPLEGAPNSMGQPFTWYKSRSKREIPPGLTKVVIWLSQI